jgi:hypothetical protein
MCWHKTATLVVLFFVVTGAAGAQRPKGATDNDLHAAYCIGALESVASPNNISGIPYDKWVDQFRAYLKATMSRRDSAGEMDVNAAWQRGRADSKECMARLNYCASIFLQGSSPNYDEYQACHLKNSFCLRQERCLGADNLPF